MTGPRFKVGDRVIERVCGPGTVKRRVRLVDRTGWAYMVSYPTGTATRPGPVEYTLNEESLEPEPAVDQLARVVRDG